MRIVPRGFTAASDAYLTPHIQHYLEVCVYNSFTLVPGFHFTYCFLLVFINVV